MASVRKELRKKLKLAIAERDRCQREKEESGQQIAKLMEDLEASREENELQAAEHQATVKELEERLEQQAKELEARKPDGAGVGVVVDPTEGTASSTCSSEGSALRLAMLAQQIPTLEKFRGDDTRGVELIGDWLEQLEMVAEAFGWDERNKLVHLTTRLAGTALAFYRSCTIEQRHSYQLLKEELEKRFTPVHVQSVQSGLFHERSQKSGESVDAYAQELKELFYRAYPKMAQGGGEEGRAVLTSRFVAGLKRTLQEKLTGMEGDFTQLLSRARLEEAKRRELRLDDKERPSVRKESDNYKESRRGGEPTQGRVSDVVCYTCNKKGHYKNKCPLRGRAIPRESEGEKSKPRVNGLSAGPGEGSSSVVEEKLATLKTLGAQQSTGKVVIGPKLEAEVGLEGSDVTALIDTGSPVSIVALDYLLQVWRARDADVPLAEWKDKVRSALRKPSLALRAYNDMELELAAETEVTLTCGPERAHVTVLVQDKAPQKLLLGTDTLELLGFRMTKVHDGPGLTGEILVGNAPTCTVKLLRAEKLPARFQRQVWIKTCPKRCHSDLLMEGEMLEPTLVETDGKGEAIVILSNHKMELINLEADQEVGTGEAVKIEVVQEKGTCPGGDKSGLVSDVMTNPSLSCCRLEAEDKGNRKVQLLQALQLAITPLGLVERDSLATLVLEYEDVFALTEEELGVTNVTQHKIETGDSVPIRQYARRIPYSMRPRVDELVDGMLQRNIIRPSSSPWASPIVLVAKRDGSLRFCVDYRRLNAVTKLDAYPLPRIDDYLDTLSGARYFSTLDLAAGYWQVAMEPSSIEKTAFATHSGTFEFCVMPFGLANAPATFQRLMATVLAGLPLSTCMDYIDDILVIGTTFEEHLDNLRNVFERLRQAGLKLKPSKCDLVKPQVRYLGYIVSAAGVSADPDKVRAVRDFPRPDSVKRLRSFLGLTSYYRRFVPSYAKVATPLYQLTKKEVPFQWTDTCEEAFSALKQFMTDAPVLQTPDFTRPFRLETDASQEGLGAVLAQEDEAGLVKPLAYASRTLRGSERNYDVTQLEALGVVWAVKHFRHYLYGHKCVIVTDHQALKAILNTPQPSGKLARWGLVLQELDAEIVYRSGKSNSNADALSRNPLTDPFPDSTSRGGEGDSCPDAVDQWGGLEAIEPTSITNTQPSMVNAKWQGPAGEFINITNTHINTNTHMGDNTQAIQPSMVNAKRQGPAGGHTNTNIGNQTQAIKPSRRDAIWRGSAGGHTKTPTNVGDTMGPSTDPVTVSTTRCDTTGTSTDPDLVEPSNDHGGTGSRTMNSGSDGQQTSAEGPLAKGQREDKNLSVIISYLESGTLPDDPSGWWLRSLLTRC